MKCSICQGEITNSDLTTSCPECENSYHQDCWNENGGCGTPGCKNLPVVNTKTEVHYAENSFWGIDNKDCPACGEKIPAASLVCPHCDEEFSSAEPISQSAYKLRKSFNPNINDGSGKIAITIFILGIIGCTSIPCLIFGGLWFLKNKEHLKASNGFFYFLALAGLIISILYTIILVFAFLHSLVS
ncbi:MAG: RING finger protein [Bacillota bacterium]|nr:RING finger protein [Bacillota bacterium]